MLFCIELKQLLFHHQNCRYHSRFFNISTGDLPCLEDLYFCSCALTLFPISALLSRIIEQGFTRNEAGEIVTYEYITTFGYNARGQVTSIDGPLPGSDDTTEFTYDGITGNLLSVTRPLIGSMYFENYDASGLVGRIIDVNGQSEMFSYDAKGRITAITHHADASTKTISYNSAGLPVSTTDEDGVTYTFDYDEVYGWLTRKTDMQGNYIAYSYDAQGNLIERSKHAPSGERTSYKRWNYQFPYMPGKLWQEIRADDTFKEYEYDGEGNLAAVKDFE